LSYSLPFLLPLFTWSYYPSNHRRRTFYFLLWNTLVCLNICINPDVEAVPVASLPPVYTAMARSTLPPAPFAYGLVFTTTEPIMINSARRVHVCLCVLNHSAFAESYRHQWSPKSTCHRWQPLPYLWHCEHIGPEPCTDVAISVADLVRIASAVVECKYWYDRHREHGGNNGKNKQ